MNKMLVKVILPAFAIVCIATFVFVQYSSNNKTVQEPIESVNSLQINKAYNLPDLAIFIGDRQIKYVAVKNRWDGIDYDREDTFKTILNKTTEAQIPYIKFGETATIRFKDNPPDKFSISDNLIDKRGIRRYNDCGTINIPNELKNGKGSFETKKHMASALDSYYVIGKTDIRAFRMTASWGENECEYAFIIKTNPF